MLKESDILYPPQPKWRSGMGQEEMLCLGSIVRNGC